MHLSCTSRQAMIAQIAKFQKQPMRHCLPSQLYRLNVFARLSRLRGLIEQKWGQRQMATKKSGAMVWCLALLGCSMGLMGCQQTLNDNLAFEPNTELIANPDRKQAVVNGWTVVAPLDNDSIKRMASMSISRLPQYGSHLLMENGLLLYTTFAVHAGKTDTILYSLTAGGIETTTAIILPIISERAAADCNRGAWSDLDTAYSDVSTPILLHPLANDGFCGQPPAAGSLSIRRQPRFGQLQLEDGRLGYLPTKDYSGYDTIIYQINSADSPPIADQAAMIIRVYQDSGCLIVATDDTLSQVYRAPIRIPIFDNDQIGCPNEVDWSSFRVLISPLQGEFRLEGQSLIYSLNRYYHGNVQTAYELCQKSGECFDANVTLRVLPCPPIDAVNDSLFLGAGQTELFDADILGNDHFCPNYVQIFELITPPKYGSAQLDLSNLRLKVYRLEAQNATDSLEMFDYRLCDGQDRCDTARVAFRLR